MAEKRLEITERDEAGNVTATFVQSSEPAPGDRNTSRVDVILPKDGKSQWQRLLDVFLPAGYPQSVTDDYLEYQIYDSLQAFSSSIAGMLSSRAVLASVGVGDASASATAALLLSVWQESAGRLATILFAHRFGTSLEPECKMYRLLADVLNDIAFILDCMSPAFPKSIRVVVLSFSSVLRALCGVAAGSAKASLSAHFAKWGNLGELNAKDSSQETVISLLGMLAGSVVVRWVISPVATWTTLIALLAIHLETNRRAVRAVQMRTLNRQRATIMYHCLKREVVPSIAKVSEEERIFESDGVLRGADNHVLGYCSMGAPMSKLLSGIFQTNASTGSATMSGSPLADLIELYRHTAYVVYPDLTTYGQTLQVNIVLKKGATVCDQLAAWWQALAFAEAAKKIRKTGKSDLDHERVDAFMDSLQSGRRMLQKYESQLREAGWDLDTGALETRSSVRIEIGSD